jgi:small subunit ribosomal protein S1
MMEKPTQTEDLLEAQAKPQRFEQLLDDYTYRPPRRGEFLEGEIIRVDEEGVLLDVGAKRDAIVTRRDLVKLDDEERQALSPGDRLPVCVVRSPGQYGGELLVSISRGMEQEDWARAEALRKDGQALRLKVAASNRGGLVVRFGRLRGFVPNSHIPGYRAGCEAAELDELKQQKSGKEMLLKVLEIDRKHNRLVLSGRAAGNERRAERLRELEPGQIIRGRVVNIVDFGAFVALGGVDGLVHISELDWRRVDHPSEVLELGQEIEVQIKGVDVERQRVSLSRRALLPNPWDEAGFRYEEGDQVEGRVTSVVHYGAFVELPEGIEGLIHKSEMGIVGPASPEHVLHPGDAVLARVINVNPAEGRLRLGLQQVLRQQPDEAQFDAELPTAATDIPAMSDFETIEPSASSPES